MDISTLSFDLGWAVHSYNISLASMVLTYRVENHRYNSFAITDAVISEILKK